ncbi:MAG: APC family permease [Acidimicrobiales bacterium]
MTIGEAAEGGDTELATQDRDESAQLAAHTVRLPGIIAQSVGAMGVTGVVALIVPLVAVTAGSGAWLTWVTAAAIILLVAWCISRLASQFATTGGPYGLVSKSLGRCGGVIVAWTSLLLIGLFSAGALFGFGVYATQSLQAFGLGSGHVVLYLAYALGLAASVAAALSGVRKSAVAMLLIEMVTAAILVILMICVLATRTGSIVDHTQLSLHHSSLTLVLDGFVLAVLSFGGFESATVLGREARNPLRAIPIAMISTVVLASLFWTFSGYTLFLGFEGSHFQMAKAVNDGVPLQDLATIAHVAWLRKVIDVTVSLTLFGSIIAVFNSVSRLMFTLAREGLAPAPLMKVHRRWGTPWVANVVLAVVWSVATLVMVLANVAPFTVIGDFGDVSGYGFMMIYILLAAGAVVYLRRTRRLKLFDLAAAVISILVMGYVFYENAFLPTPDGWIFYAVLATFVAMVVAYAAIRAIRPRFFDRVGTSVDTDTEL